jgi:hypothetical protein
MAWLGICLVVFLAFGTMAVLAVRLYRRVATNWPVWPVAVALPLMIGWAALFGGSELGAANVVVKGAGTTDPGPLVGVAVMAFALATAIAAFFGGLVGVIFAVLRKKAR